MILSIIIDIEFKEEFIIYNIIAITYFKNKNQFGRIFNIQHKFIK